MGIDRNNLSRSLLLLLIVWLLTALALVVMQKNAIGALDFPDTDDAQRMVEVRDWLGGQAWGDVDQHRMNPPVGANMHWSRLVDLPIAALIVAAEPIAGKAAAERFAASAVPLIALLAVMGLAALAASRLAGYRASVLAILFVAASGQLLPLFRPLRIDHHGWQIALMVCAVAMLLDPRRRFLSGAAAGLATVAALAIGLEMLPHLVVAGAVLVAGWCLQPSLGRMMSGYGLALAVGTVAAYPAFVPPARWWLVACDAMSPVYFAALVFGGVLAALLPKLDVLNTPARRTAAALFGFGSVGAAVLGTFPQCANGPMAELDPSFLPILARISEARSLPSYFADAPQIAVFYGLYPLIGIACAVVMLRRAERERRFGWWLLLAVLVATSLLMLIQLRAATGPNTLAAVAAACLASALLPKARAIPALLPRMAATLALFIGLTSALPMFLAAGLAATADEPPAGDTLASCTSAQALLPLAELPRGTIANVFDMGPALLVHTPHSVIAGPYHRTPTMIADSVRLWRANNAEAQRIIAHYGATYLLACAGAFDLDAATKEAPSGLWAQIEAGKTPAWLEPMPLPKDSPLKLFRIRG